MGIFFLFNILKLHVSTFKSYMTATVVPEIELQNSKCTTCKDVLYYIVISKNKQTNKTAVWISQNFFLFLSKMVKYLTLKNNKLKILKGFSKLYPINTLSIYHMQ